MSIAKYIDHTILRADTRLETVKRYCKEAKEHRFASVCVNGVHVKTVVEELKGSDVLCCAVVGFPLGAMDAEVKAFEAKKAVEAGAAEIDMVMNIGKAKDGAWDFVEADIASVVTASRPARVKVIIETCLLNDEEKILACRAAERAGAAFVKTSTGFSTQGATLEDVSLMREAVGNRLGVKASGGIRDAAFAKALLEAGASRIGASNGIKLIET